MMINIVILFAFVLFNGWIISKNELGANTSKKQFIYTFLFVAIVAAILVGSGLAYYSAKFLFRMLPNWLAFFTFLIVCVGSLGAIIFFACRGIVQDLVRQGKPITGFYLIVTILCVLVVTWILVSAEVIPTWLGWTLTILLSIDRCFAIIVHRHDKKLYEDKEQKDDKSRITSYE